MTGPRTWLTTALRLVAGIAIVVPAALLLGASPAAAHPMPHSVVRLDVYKASVTARLELPVGDFATASGIDLTDIESSALPAKATAIRSYLGKHIRPTTLKGEAWQVGIGALSLSRTQQTSTGPYRELTARAVLPPPAGADVRHFTLNYDVIVHQVVTHVTLVSVRQDWAAGRFTGDGATQVGTIRLDVRHMSVPPLTVDLGKGSAWRGFVAMVELGGNHILTGTDHLLFLLILLLPAPLMATGRRWDGLVGARTALGRIGRITLAFTAGHSIALAATALGRVEIPGRPVEAFIAASILVGAVHASVLCSRDGKRSWPASSASATAWRSPSCSPKCICPPDSWCPASSASTWASNWSSSCWSASLCPRCWYSCACACSPCYGCPAHCSPPRRPPAGWPTDSVPPTRWPGRPTAPDPTPRCCWSPSR